MIGIVFLVLSCALTSIHASETAEFLHNELRAQHFSARAEQYFHTHSLAESCHAFLHNDEWRDGTLRLFLWDADGYCLVCGHVMHQFWERHVHARDYISHEPFFTAAQRVGEKGGWVDGEQNNAEVHLYIKTVELHKRRYFLGVGFYHVFAEPQVMRLVRQMYDSLVTRGFEETCTLVSNPHGVFVNGSLYGFINDEWGFYKAHGLKQFLIGQSIFTSVGPWSTLPDAVKAFMHDKAQEGWLPGTILWARTAKRLFGMKYHDKSTGKLYMLFSGYYPDMTTNSLVQLVESAISYIKAEGQMQAMAEFNKPLGQFDIGSVMNIFVYTDAGLCLANGENPYAVGESLLEYRDADGSQPVRELIEEVLTFGHTWRLHKDKNAYKLIYAEKMITPAGKTIIVGSGFWPINADQYVAGLMKRAQQALSFYGVNYAFEQFVLPTGAFLRGSSYVSVYTMQGVCLVRGPRHMDAMWTQMQALTDDGREIFPLWRDMALQGGGWVSYVKQGVEHKVLVALQDTVEWGAVLLVSGFHI